MCVCMYMHVCMNVVVSVEKGDVVVSYSTSNSGTCALQHTWPEHKATHKMAGARRRDEVRTLQQ